MPIIESKFKPPFFFRQTDIATIFSAKIRKVKGVQQKRERLEFSDGDFVDLDWSYGTDKTDTCILLLHGLEGAADRAYILGTAKYFNKAEIDVCAMNFRSCSGELNRTFGCYHSGKTDDVLEVLQYLIKEKHYKKIILKGVSLGGNVALKLVGDNIGIPTELKAVVAVSTPCDLAGSAKAIISRRNIIYGCNFHRHLIKKLKNKQKLYPDKISDEQIKSVKNLMDFDDLYTSVAHGFENAADYYAQCSSLNVLENIKIPTLILNAKNDSFLSDKSYPYEIAMNHEYLYLETPKYGGHVAFWQKNNVYYNEQRALEFVTPFIKNT